MFIIELIGGLVLGALIPGIGIHRYRFRLGAAVVAACVVAIVIMATPVGWGARAALVIGLALGFAVCISRTMPPEAGDEARGTMPE